MFELISIANDEQLRQLAVLSSEIWHECFPGIISEGQIDYMVKRFQSYDAMKRQLADEGYRYYYISDDNGIAGYTGFVLHPEEDYMFLSKLYLRADRRGRGLASKTIDQLRDICRENALHRIRLTVNINNRQAINVYKHKGFIVAYDQKADIGNGYYMDDHVMELTVN